jgi:predicted CXXCH cytochrome family protein
MDRPVTTEHPGRPERSRKWIAGGVVLVLLALTLGFVFYVYPGQGIGPQQPIYFSHRIHAGVKQINCRFCHPYVDRSTRAGLPPMEKCFYCHKYIIPQHPQLVKELKHFEEKDPVRWVRIFFVPDYVKFRHEPHISWAKIDCSRCHGDVAAMDRLMTHNFQMGFCIQCHKERKAQTDCWLACHH